MDYLKLTALCALLFCTGCDFFEFSPYAIKLPEQQTDINKKNITRFMPDSATSYTVALIADPHTGYTSLSSAVDAINRSNPAMTLVVGDITDKGTQEEFVRTFTHLEKLENPFVAVLGNHDCLSQGTALYRRMYGPENTTFITPGVKWVIFNDIVWENGSQSPDLAWLEEELSDREGCAHLVVVAHIPPFTDQMAPYETKWVDLMRRYRVSASIHGHNHTGGVTTPYSDSVPYVVVGSTQEHSLVYLTVTPDSLHFERKDF